MLVTSISLALAIVSFYISANLADEVEQLVFQVIALLLVILSVAFAPLLIKLLIFIAWLITAKQSYILNQDKSVLDAVLEKIDRNTKTR